MRVASLHFAFRFISLSLLCGVALAGRAAGSGRAPEAAPPHAEGRLLVRFKAGVDKASKDALVRAKGSCKRDYAKFQKQHHDFFSNLVLVELPGATGDECRAADCRCVQAVEALRQDAGVQDADLDWIKEPCGFQAAPVNDPDFPKQWGLYNPGSETTLARADVHAPEAWATGADGSSVLCVIVGSGIDWRHPDLLPNVWTNPGEIEGNGIDDDGNGFIDDVHGWDFSSDDNDATGHPDFIDHETHCAGILAAVGNNAIGITGSAPAAKILPIRNGVSLSTGISSTQYALQMGARIFSESWNGANGSPIANAEVQAVDDAGGLYFHVAGNTNSNPGGSGFGSLAEIVVGATDPSDRRAGFSSFGPWVDICAPGTDIYSTIGGGHYGYMSGTSMATPMTAGLGALLLGRGVPHDLARTLLINGADPIEILNPAFVGLLGSGRANIQMSLAGWTDVTPPGAPSLTAPICYAAMGTTAVLNGTAATDNLRVAGYRVEKSSDGTTFTEVPGKFRIFPMKVTGLSPGSTMTFRVRAYDVPGTPGPYSNAVTFTMPSGDMPPLPPLAPTTSATWFAPGTPYTFSMITPFDQEGQIMFDEVDWGDGSPVELSGGNVPAGTVVNFTHAWTSVGSYAVRARARQYNDLRSLWSPSLAVTVTATAPPPPPPPATLTLTAAPRFGISPINDYNPLVLAWSGASTTPAIVRHDLFQSADGTTFTLLWTGASNASASTYYVTGATNTSSTKYKVVLTDVNGGQQVSNVVGIGRFPTQPLPPTGGISGFAGTAYTYYSTSTDAEGSPLVYTCDWGDGSTSSSAPAASGVSVGLSHTWKTSGLYYVRFQARDDAGYLSPWSEGKFVSVRPAKPGVPTLSGPTTSQARIDLYYVAQASDNDNAQLTYSYSWGDGTVNEYLDWVGTALPRKHQWATPGSYLVQVSVRDAFGAVATSATLAVTIVANTPPSAPTGLSAGVTKDGSTFRVNLAWAANPETDVSMYEVLRATSQSGNYASLAFLQLPSFVDYAAANGTTYYYKIRAWDSISQAGATSAALKVVIPRK